MKRRPHWWTLWSTELIILRTRLKWRLALVLCEFCWERRRVAARRSLKRFVYGFVGFQVFWSGLSCFVIARGCVSPSPRENSVFSVCLANYLALFTHQVVQLFVPFSTVFVASVQRLNQLLVHVAGVGPLWVDWGQNPTLWYSYYQRNREMLGECCL